MPNRIAITKYNNQYILVFIKDDKAVKIRFLDDLNSYTGSVYLGRIKTVKQNISASFVKYNNKIGYLATKDIKPETLLPVIVKKETPGNKEDELTDKIVISGLYVIINENIKDVRFSKRSFDSIKTNSSFNSFTNAIIRTNANNIDEASVINEYNYLKQYYTTTVNKASYCTENNILYKGILTLISYIFSEDLSEYDEILTDDLSVYNVINDFIINYKEHNINIPISLNIYNDKLVSLYSLLSLSSKINRALDRKVYLKSDAYLCFDYTEAMTIIDVNSGTTTFKGDKASVIHMINLEALKEISIQLKLRNLSGMILVDFINEKNKENREDLINELKKAFCDDDAHAKFIDLTKLDIAEITRDRVDKPIREQIWK